LVLSIWSADAKLVDQSSWRRRLIVNDCLAEYFDTEAVQLESVLTTDEEEKLRLRTRIRSFAWAPMLPLAQAASIIGTQLTWAQHIVAVTNDDNQVVFALVDSPTTSLGLSESWDARVLNHFSVTPDSNSIFSEIPTSFDDIMHQQRFISHIAWSPWIMRDGSFRSVLAYSTNDDVRARIVTYTYNTIEFGEELTFATIDLRNNGAMKWSPGIIGGDKLILAMFAHSDLTCLTVSVTDASVLSQSSMNADGDWGEISGIVWDHSPNLPVHLHFSSLRTTMSSATSALEVSETGSLSVLPSPNWREHINNSRALFSIQNDLQGNVRSKVWGLCASPLGDFIATCHTLHPSDMVEYGAAANRSSTFAINSLQSANQPEIHIPTSNTSAEALMFTIRRWLETNVEDTEQISEFTDKVLAKVNRVYEPVETSTGVPDTATYESGDLAQLTRELKCE
jgi:hypothetical protein